MILTKQIAKHFRDVYFGDNWTASNLRDNVKEITWQQATREIHSLNSIAVLVYHMNYFVNILLKVLEGGPLEGNDKFSFDVPLIQSNDDWEKLIGKALSDAENVAKQIEVMPESKLWEDFSENKYGSYYRNIVGIIEHNHYHLGQIAVIRKIIFQEEKK